MTLAQKPYSVGAMAAHQLSGSVVANVMRRMLLMLLNPYLCGSARRIGAPFCGVSGAPNWPATRKGRSFQASSMVRPST